MACKLYLSQLLLLASVVTGIDEISDATLREHADKLGCDLPVIQGSDAGQNWTHFLSLHQSEGLRPVLIRDLADEDWPAMQWAAGRLEEKFGNLQVRTRVSKQVHLQGAASALKEESTELGSFLKSSAGKRGGPGP
eukprot:TRINITY_DN27108_c0_g1_i1.p1 TRINITY_DN27108_c0_g1~~TRINITY_DN27108_c0_g1_i1.p1  ORF type:complete len:136 (+),score=22.47 TRINITY_DN27108_c0_g1_i1:40-447(+)